MDYRFRYNRITAFKDIKKISRLVSTLPKTDYTQSLPFYNALKEVIQNA